MSGAVQGLIANLVSAAASATDTFFRYVSLLLNTSATNGAQNNTFLDSSTNNFSITRNGNTTQGTFSPFSQTGWSNVFDGTGDFLSVASNAAFDLGSSDFTVECWFYPNSVSAGFGLLSRYAFSGVASGWVLNVPNSTTLRFVRGNDVLLDATITALVTGQWYHAAAVRNGSTLTLYLNGTQVAQATGIANFADAATTVQIGRTHTVTNDLNGYISNARIVKGTAVYTSNFTPPTAPLTAITNTSLLTCQSNRFIDNSSNAFAITRNGDVSVQAFSPFAPTAAWSASTNGGSGYFDGTGDYLEAPDNAAFAFGSGDFTIEGWIYPTAYATADNDGNFVTALYTQQQSNPVSSKSVLLYLLGTSSSYTSIRFDGSSNNTTTTTIIGTFTFALNTWYHVACVRNGNNVYLYVNGTQVNSTTAFSLTLQDSTVTPKIGAALLFSGFNYFWYFTGYISNFRIVKGTAVYTANFTPPTAPLTAITNTSLLLNFTNAGIFDSASGNNLETVGNAQVSTVQAKWGTTSMYFDGTGDYLVSNSDANNYAFGSGDFTIEMWVRYASTSGIQVLYDGRPSGTQGAYPTVYSDAGSIRYYANTGDRITGSTLSINVWYHIAVARSGTSTKMFIDGTQVGATYTDSTNYLGATGRPSIGDGLSFGTYPFNGYIDDLRITKGVARYTANFTPPTAAFPLQ